MLQLTPVGFKYGNVVHFYRDCNGSVLGLFFQETKHLSDQFLKVCCFYPHIHMPCESQETLGDSRTSIYGRYNRVNKTNELFVMGIRLRKSEQVFNKTGLLVNNGQGVVDFMGHSRSQPPDGGHFIRVFRLMECNNPFFISHVYFIYHTGNRT